MDMLARIAFDGACHQLVNDVRAAEESDWFPYHGETDAVALGQLRCVYRRGRALGLIPPKDAPVIAPSRQGDGDPGIEAA